MNNLILTGYRHPSIKLYKPKRNKKKLGLLGSVVVLLGFIPGPNVLGIGIVKAVNKFSPIWIYQ